MAFGLIGILLGLVLGAALPIVAGSLLKPLLPFPLSLDVYPGEIALGLAYGLVTVLTFSLVPLSRAKTVPASTLFRDDELAKKGRLPLPDLILITLSGAAFVAWRFSAPLTGALR